MKSKFSLWSLLPVAILLPVSLLLVVMAERLVKNPPDKWIGVACFYAFFLFIWIWLFFGELRTRIICVRIEDDRLITAGFFGLGTKKTRMFTDLDGYETSLLPSRYNTYEYLFVMMNGRRVARISGFYHRNYKELKASLTGQLKYRGHYDFRLTAEIKDIFG